MCEYKFKLESRLGRVATFVTDKLVCISEVLASCSTIRTMTQVMHKIW